ncbi:MAG: CTP-dependent riboflavin kinase [Acidobacteriota bacterium]|nr:CTP-dependent riboflavin kinase [Acidobacteriota bacterium]
MVEKRKIAGVICSGLGEGADFMSLDWVKQILRERLGFSPYPATLNLLLESDEDIRSWEEIQSEIKGIEIPPPDRAFCHACCWLVQLVSTRTDVEKKVEGAILLPQVAGYPGNKVEVVAPVHIKNSLGVRDGDSLTLEFKGSER